MRSGIKNRPGSGLLRRALFQIHLWLGLAVGLYIVVISLSGSAIVFRREYDRALCPRIVMVEPAGRQLTHQELETVALKRYSRNPTDKVEVRGPAVPGAAVEISVVSDANRRDRLLNPYTGADLGQTVECEPGFVSWLADLHDNLLAGHRGLVANGVGAAALLVMFASGAVLWWPGRTRLLRSVTLQKSASWRRFIRQLHSVAGFWISLMILVWGVTGLYFAFPMPFDTFVESFSAGDGESQTSLMIDSVLTWLVRVHFGRTFGTWVEALWVVIGLLPGALFVSGAVMWWNRVLSKALQRAHDTSSAKVTPASQAFSASE